MESPAKEEVIKLRNELGLSQRAAAEIIHSNRKSWQNWEYGGSTMHPGLWELFNIKTRALRRKIKKQNV